MSKILILTLGYQEFILPPKTKVQALLEVLEAAIPVDHDYRKSLGGWVYFPDLKGGHEISIQYVDRKQLLPSRPAGDEEPEKPEPAILALENGGANAS